MNKREKIREGIARRLTMMGIGNPDWKLADILIQYLDSQGVVIQVDRELPVLLVDAGKAQTVRDTKCAILKAGFGAFERLIG